MARTNTHTHSAYTHTNCSLASNRVKLHILNICIFKCTQLKQNSCKGQKLTFGIFFFPQAFALFFFSPSKSDVSEGQTATTPTTTLKRKKKKKKGLTYLSNKNLKSNLIRHFWWEKALLNPGTERLCQNTPWWIINKITMNLRWTLKHRHFILHTAQACFKQTPRRWFRQCKPLPVGELHVSQVSPQRPLCLQHPYIKSGGKALPNISFSRPFLCL